MVASGTLRVGRCDMYKSFRVKNFRCFKDLQINDLGRVNLIAGKNNTGKTALLEAIYLQTKPLKPEVWSSIQQLRNIDFASESFSSYWDQYFYMFDANEPIELNALRTVTSQFSELLVSKLYNNRENADAFERYRRHLLQLQASAIEANMTIESTDAALDFQFRIHTAGSEQTRSAFMLSTTDQPIFAGQGVEQRSAFLPVQGRPNKQTEIEEFSRLDNSGKLSKLIEVIWIFEPNLSDLRLSSPYGEMLIWGKVNGANIPLKAMGEGVNRVAHFATTMISMPNSVVIIDEIENGIHYSVQCKVWKAIGALARELDIQVFATTHSLEMIRAAYEAFSEANLLEDFRYHRLARSRKTGDIKATTYNELDMEAVAAFDFEHEVR